MTAELGLSDTQLDRLFERARAAEADGRLDDALGALTVAVAELTAHDETYRYLFEWMAQLESALGHHAAADEMALVARDLAAEAGSSIHAFRMEVLRARIAAQALEIDRGEAILAGVQAGMGALGPPIAGRLDAIVEWLRAMVFPNASARDLAMARCEAALAIAELWSERGCYRSALRVLDVVVPEIPIARAAIRADQVQLLRAELQLAVGALADAHRALDDIPPQSTALDRGRVALVRVRTGLAGGQLARADRELATLQAIPPGDPMLFASAAVARAAVEMEFNELGRAAQIAAEAKKALAVRGAPPAALELIERTLREAAARNRSAFLPLEAAYIVGGSASTMPLPPTYEPVGSRWRFTTTWTAAANAVLFALERGDQTTAATEQARLEALTREVESEYVASRVALSAAMVAYYGGHCDARRFLSIAARLQSLGARSAEAQAMRFAGWAAARRKHYDDHAAFARRASAILDEIAAELDLTRRGPFMRNKWDGRDELVEDMLRTLLGKRSPNRRELCSTFRTIDRLTHQPVDEVLGDRDAATFPRNATAREIHAWLDSDAARRRAKQSRSAGLTIRSPWSLWRIPARTLILHYHVLPDRTFLFRMARRHIDVRILPYGRIHFALDMRAAADDDEQLRYLASSTGIADAVANFPRVDRLVIVPHGAIASVPFAALPVGDHRLCQIRSIVQLDRIGRLRRRRGRRGPGRLLSVGRTRYRGSGLADLPSAEREAVAVLAATGSEDRPVLDATREQVCEKLPGATRLHIAAHGLFDIDQPERSGIVLGGADGHYPTLTLRELRGLDLSALELATLATCRSAEHARLPGRERVCLPTALLDAGTRGVIASLWPVEDEPSVEVMRALYHQLQDHRPAVALARMQADLAQRPVTERLPTRCWAGLVFYGNE